MATEPAVVSPNPMLMQNAAYHNMEVPAESLDLEEEYLRMFDYQKSVDRLKRLIGDWRDLKDYAEDRRRKRNIEVNLEQLKSEGKLKADEVLIPIRVIHENINKEKPGFITFLKQSRRLCVFTDKENPSANTQPLEEDFTRINTYLKWSDPHEKVLDGAQLHGWDQVEIEFDQARPGYVGLSHIGHENLYFQLNAQQLEDCEEVLRRFDVTLVRFEELAKSAGFDPDQVTRILKRRRIESNKETEDVTIYKRFFKYDGAVYVCWFADFSESSDVTNWLREPRPLYLGVKRQEMQPSVEMTPLGPIPTMVPTMIDVQEIQYPIKQLFYDKTEEPKIIDHKGRCFLDITKQDAQTAMWSIYINGSVRASNVFGSPKDPSGAGGRIEKLDLELEGGCIYNTPLEFWNMPYPSPDLLKATNSLDVRTAAEQGEIAASVINREDSRKTAKEISHAESKELLQSSVQVGNFSTYVSEVYQEVWRVQQSLALQGVLTILFGRLDLVGREYIVKASGDIDVVKRQEKLEKRMAAWPLVAMTPIAGVFLVDILKEMFPDDAIRYEQILQAESAKDQVIASLGGLLQGAVTGDNGEIRPEFKQFEPQLKQLGQGLSNAAVAQKQAQVQGTGQQPTNKP